MRWARLRTHGGFITLSTLLALGLFAAPAWGATIVVPSPPNFTIADAITAASPGDTVLVKKGGGTGPNGEYHEAVDITKTLTFKCAGAVLDGAPEDDPQIEDDGINISGLGAVGTKVIGCKVQNFGDKGIEVDDVDDVTIKNCTLIGNDSDGLRLKGNNFIIRGNTAINNDNGIDIQSDSSDGLIVGNVAHSNNSEGIDMDGSDNKRNTFLNNKSFRNGNEGFRLKGEDHTLIGNRAETNDGEGFQLTGGFRKSLVERNLSRGNDEQGFDCSGCDENTFLRNVAINNVNEGFKINGDDNKLIKNLSIGNQEEGFDIDGDDNEVTGNRAIGNQEDGFDINCNDSVEVDVDDEGVCGGPIIGNRSIRNVDDHGFDLHDLDDTTVSGNKSIGNEDEGFYCNSCKDVLFENNLARDNGGNGFEQTAPNGDVNERIIYKNNRSIGNDRDGFEINDSATLTLIRNTVNKNNGDGIDIDDGTTDVVIDGNRVFRNRGTGIENDGGSDTDLKNNVVKGNRTDIAGRGDSCSNAPATDGGSNTFVTGGFKVCSPGTGDE